MNGKAILRIRVLGPLEVLVDGRAAVLGPPKQRLLLAVLLARANKAVSVDQLIDVLWDECAPRSARKCIQVYVSGLRKALGDRIGFSGGGYLCRTEPEECDLLRFEQLTAAGRRAARSGDRETACRVLAEAVRLWPDRAFADLTVAVAWFAAESDRLQERFLAAYEDWVELEVGLGRYISALDSLDELATRYPARERLSVCRMMALSGCGRTSEALAHYDRLRQSLAQDLGIEPSPVLRALYQRLLTGTGAAAQPSGAGPSPVAGPAGDGPGIHQLPRRLVDFVGRGDDLDRILNTGTDVTVISGRGGAGKTALAVQAGYLLRETYPDGELFVRLRDVQGHPIPPAEAVHTTLRATSLASCLAGDAADTLPLWRSWLSERRMVVVADDAPDEESVNALLPGSGSCLVMMTSHRRLSGLSCVLRITLGDFEPDEAIELLGRILGPGRVRAGQAALRRVLATCGSSPRVVRILGNKLLALPHVSIADFADRLDALPDPLEELVAGDSSVRAGFDRWFRRLPRPHQRALLRLTSLPVQAFTYEDAVGALSGIGRRPDRLIEALLGRTDPWHDPEPAATAPDVKSLQVAFDSADGTRIRMFIILAGGVPDRPRPTILTGYGGFGASRLPHYSPDALAWAELGGVYAVACLRGGGEEGEQWHHAGRGAAKKRVFEDFEAAADWLVANGWSTPERLGILGGSNGGLLVGAALTRRPEKYAAAVCVAPLLDMVRYELSGLGPSWREEYGSVADPEAFANLLSYSPYHRVRDGERYPAVLFAVSDGDSRVDPLHARKMCAALQFASTGPDPILLRAEKGVGHGARAASSTIALTADILAFFAERLRLANAAEDGAEGRCANEAAG